MPQEKDFKFYLENMGVICSLLTDNELNRYKRLYRIAIDNTHLLESLQQLRESPVFSGDSISNSYLREICSLGLATMSFSKGKHFNDFFLNSNGHCCLDFMIELSKEQKHQKV